jgi:hypothetical protein
MPDDGDRQVSASANGAFPGESLALVSFIIDIADVKQSPKRHA